MPDIVLDPKITNDSNDSPSSLGAFHALDTSLTRLILIAAPLSEALLGTYEERDAQNLSYLLEDLTVQKW